MSAQQTFVIVGAGLAGAKAAETLRTNGFDGNVIFIGDEDDRPYDRPPLSKGYLLGSTEREKIYIHPARWHMPGSRGSISGCTLSSTLPTSSRYTASVCTLSSDIQAFASRRELSVSTAESTFG